MSSELPISDKILIVDFGSQVTQLIAWRVREAGVYCEIHLCHRVDAVPMCRPLVECQLKRLNFP